MRDLLDGPDGRAAGGATSAWLAGSGSPARVARRYLLKEAVSGARPQVDSTTPPPAEGDGGWVPRVVTGAVLDVSPQVLVIGTGKTEERFALTADANAWRGEKTTPTALRIGDQAVVRRHPSGREVADRIWANIGRITGTIYRRHKETLVVDCGGAGLRTIVVQQQAAGKIQVRFPRLEPGYLIDVIGIRRDGYLEGLIPATSQPPYRADHVPAPPLVNGHLPATVKGSATWHEPGTEPAGLTGLNWPAVDVPDGAPTTPPGCVSLPYLSVGSRVRITNDCARESRTLPVTGAAPLARLFCDRSVVCGPSPRGRIADLTVASFVELGGELDEGSFNATIEIEA